MKSKKHKPEQIIRKLREAKAIPRHGEQAGLEMLYIEPGAPWQATEAADR